LYFYNFVPKQLQIYYNSIIMLHCYNKKYKLNPALWHRAIIIIFILSFYFADNVLSTENPKSSAEIFEVYQRLADVKLDPENTAEVRDITLKRDRAEIHLNKGKIFFLEPVENFVTGAVFIGEGRFIFIPPNDIETQQVQRFIKESTVDKKIKAVYFRFADSTYREFNQKISERESKSKIDKDALNFLKSREEYLKKRLNYNMPFRMLMEICSSYQSGYFFADCKVDAGRRWKSGENYMLMFEPYSYENVQLSQYREFRTGKPHYTLCSYQLGDYSSSRPVIRKRKIGMNVSHYDMDVTIKKNGNMHTKVDLTLKSGSDGIQFVYFNMAEKLKIEKVADSDGMELPFVREKKDDNSLRVILDSPISEGEERTIHIEYEGDIIERTSDGS